MSLAKITTCEKRQCSMQAKETVRQSPKGRKRRGIAEKSHLRDCKSNVMLLLMSSQVTAVLTLEELKGALDKGYTFLHHVFSWQLESVEFQRPITFSIMELNKNLSQRQCICVTLKINPFPAIQFKVLHVTVDTQKTVPGLTKNSQAQRDTRRATRMYSFSLSLSLKKKIKIKSYWLTDSINGSNTGIERMQWKM